MKPPLGIFVKHRASTSENFIACVYRISTIHPFHLISFFSSHRISLFPHRRLGQDRADADWILVGGAVLVHGR